MRRGLERILQRREVARRQPQSRRGQPVREPGVLGKQRTVEIGAEDRPVRPAADALPAVAVVVAVAVEHAPERRGALAEVRAPPVVLETGELLRALAEIDLDGDVADQPRAGIADGLEVHETHAGEPLAAELVGVAEQLVAAADREYDAPALRGGVERVALDRGEVERAELLVTVLTAAEVEEIVRVRVDLVPEARALELEADAAPLAAPLEQQQVATVGIDVHEIRIQRADPQDAVSHAASPPSRRGAPPSPRWGRAAPGAARRRRPRARARRR